jgi:hypothetical protein
VYAIQTAIVTGWPGKPVSGPSILLDRVPHVEVIEEIFRGRAGLQFITIFSLVIAIILFGIAGVLEGKELAALFGGLAGYILGQSGATVERAAAGGQSRQAVTRQGDAAGGQPQADAERRVAA